MKKRILPLVFLVVVGLCVLRPACAYAAAGLDPNAEASMTLHYRKENHGFAGLPIAVYRVAEASSDGTFALIEPFASYSINIHGISSQEQWNRIAQTLCSYIVANQVMPDREATTDANGTAYLPTLETGLYFVREAVAENDTGTYIFNQFMIYLPTPRPDGTYDYDVEANPKCTEFVPKTRYTVTKLWEDAGKQNLRPREITVEIYRDGMLQETQSLNTSNNWSYTWTVSGEDHGRWTVAERSVLDAYQVTVQQSGSTFSIINTCGEEPEHPKTGDSFTPLPWILALCFSGVMLLILDVYRRRCK